MHNRTSNKSIVECGVRTPDLTHFSVSGEAPDTTNRYKKLSYVLFFLLLCNTTLLAKPKFHAKAQEIVNKITIPSSFQADFIYTIQEKDAEEVQEIAGKLWIKANKYRLILDQQIIISNGTTLWSYFPEFNEVHINTCQAEEEAERQRRRRGKHFV